MLKILSHNPLDAIGALLAPVAREVNSIGRALTLMLGVDDNDLILAISRTPSGGWSFGRATLTPASYAIGGFVTTSSALPSGASKRYNWTIDPSGNIPVESSLNPQTLEDFINSLIAGSLDEDLTAVGGGIATAAAIQTIVVNQVGGEVLLFDSTTPSGVVISSEIAEVGTTGNLWE